MQVTLKITEDSKVELIKDNCQAVQGECCVTDFVFEFPETIKGHAIDEYVKHIEFGECKQYGECVKFLDAIEGDTYKLNDKCTAFKKIMVQLVLERNADGEKIIWKTVPFMLEFVESVNAEGSIELQAQILHLEDIKNDWQAYIKAHTLRIIYRVGDVPAADATSLGDTIFYLGANSNEPYALTYGHYYRCTFANNVYAWTDLTQDPSLADVANGVREINQNQTTQFWIGTAEDLENEVPQDNVLYLPIDQDQKGIFNDTLTEMAEDEKYKLAYPIKFEDGHLKYGGEIVRRQTLIFESSEGVGIDYDTPLDISALGLQDNDLITIEFAMRGDTYVGREQVTGRVGMTHSTCGYLAGNSGRIMQFASFVATKAAISVKRAATQQIIVGILDNEISYSTLEGNIFTIYKIYKVIE